MPDLTKSDYQALLETISAIYLRSNKEAEISLNKIRTQAYWEIGKHIIKVEQANKLRADYGARLIENLSRDLIAKFGNGFSESNLQYMRRFYQAYPSISQTSGKLPWSTYQLLSTIKDDDKREELTQKAVKKGWSVRELKDVIKEQRLDIETITRALPAPEDKDPAPVKLKASMGELYTYRLKFFAANLIQLPGDESREGKYLVDLGFNIFRDNATRGLKTVKDQMIVAAHQSKDGFTLQPSGANASDLYTYAASIEKVIDGDTLTCLVDLGFGTRTSQKLRLRGIDCPELSTQKGQEAKQFVEKVLKGKSILIKTHKDDKYGRYLVDVWYTGSAGEQIYLNQLLLDKGLAVIYTD